MYLDQAILLESLELSDTIISMDLSPDAEDRYVYKISHVDQDQ